MAPDSIARRSRPSPRPGVFKFLRTRLGQVFVALAVMGLVDRLLFPLPYSNFITFFIWVYLLAFCFRFLASIRTKLLWKIRRKLFISYLFIGLVPTVLILLFFGLAAFFLSGQISSYMFNTELDRADSEIGANADLLISEIARQRRGRSRLAEAPIRETIKPHLDSLLQEQPEAQIAFLEHRRERIQRVLASGEPPPSVAVGTNLPVWMKEGYRGPVRIDGQNYLAAVSTRLAHQPDYSVLVLMPLENILADTAQALGFRMDQILTSVREEQRQVDLISSSPILVDGNGDLSMLSFPWIALFPTRMWDEARDGEQEYVFVRFSFSPLRLYRSVATNALQLGPNGPDVGRIILSALAVLAILFLAIEAIAIVVGMILARSITGSVHALSEGTQHVRQGDFGYKVRVRSEDQLGELADSFNLMTTSIQDLLTQSAEKERLEEELRIARSIQMSLLPQDRISVPGLSIAALCLPATEVGGDYYDFLPMGEGKLALLIADVSGKGTSAALYMAELKGLILSLSRVYQSPRQLLIEANKILAENLDSKSFITMAYAVIDVANKKMTFSRAGHNPIVHVSRNGAGHKSRLLAPNGLGLALDRGSTFEKVLIEDTVDLEQDDFFLFFTDGVTEAMNPDSELFGEDRLRRIMESNAQLSMEELREKMIDEVFTFAEGAVQHDDMTMVLVKVL